MRRSPWMLAALASLTLAACGGGGSDVAGSGDDDPNADSTTLTSQEQIQQILQGCAASSTDELLALFQILQPFLESDSQSSVPPGLTFTGIDLLDGTIDWVIDFDDNGSNDATGTAGFRTPSDQPYVPNLLPLLGGASGLPAVIAGLPDGTILRSTFNMSRGFTATGSADVVFANPLGTEATPSASSGNVTITQPDCTVRFEWTNVSIPDLTTTPGTVPYPNTTVRMQVQTAEDTVTGSVAFNGTSIATIDSMLQSTGESQSFMFDLETGALTATP